jgi:hypothetical protein
MAFHNGNYSSGHSSGLSPDFLSSPIKHQGITKPGAKVQINVQNAKEKQNIL